MAKMHHALIGATMLVCAQLGYAQTGADVTTGPQGPVSVPPSAMPEANGAYPSSGGSAPMEQSSGGLAVGTIVQTQPPTNPPSAASESNDPFVQRREARAQARQEYRARVEAAKREYREDKRAADAILERSSGN